MRSPDKRVRSPSAKRLPTFTALADGSLSNKLMERFALFVADGITVHDAWRLIGKQNIGGSSSYRQTVEASEPFKKRLADLLAEKETLMADDLFGEMKWMANQLWRDARARADATMSVKAAELRWKILEKEAAARGVGEGAAAARGPGRPAEVNPQTSAGMADVKARLLSLGIKPPGAPSSAPEGAPPAAPVDPPPAMIAELESMLERAVPA